MPPRRTRLAAFLAVAVAVAGAAASVCAQVPDGPARSGATLESRGRNIGGETSTAFVGRRDGDRPGRVIGRRTRDERPADGAGPIGTKAAGLPGSVRLPAGRVGFGMSAGHADRLLAHRLAQIGRLRDRAVEVGDEAMLRQCERLEVIARAQFDRRAEIKGTAAVGATMPAFREPGGTTARRGSPGGKAPSGVVPIGGTPPTTDDGSPILPAGGVATEAGAGGATTLGSPE